MSLSLSERALLATESRTLSLSQLRVKVKAGDKWLVVGMTGTGKTTFTRRLLKSLEKLYPTSRIYILDTNYRGDFDDFPGIVQSDKCPPKPGQNERYQVWQPILEDPNEIEEWLWGIRHDPPAWCNIDELLALCSGGYSKSHPSDEFRRLLKLGRALPVGVSSGTQELVDIPRNAIGQTTHVVRFTLQLPYEVQLVNAIMRKKVTEPEDEHGFYYGPNKGNPLYFKSVDQFLGK